MAGVFYFPLLGTPTAEGNQLWFYEAGLDVPLDVWTDSDLTIPWVQPIVFNATGNPDGLIYVSPAPAYKVVYQDADDVPIPGYPVDFVSPSTILNVTTTSITVLTNAQIKALPTTPITVVDAPNSGTRIKYLGGSVRLNSVAGLYTNLNATRVTLQIQTASGNWLSLGAVDDSTTVPALTQCSSLLGSAANQLMDLGTYAGSQSTTPKGWVIPWGSDTVATNYDGAAIQIAIDNNGSGALTGGNAANTMTVTIYYAVESLA